MINANVFQRLNDNIKITNNFLIMNNTADLNNS